MKKIINVSKNEVADIESEETRTYIPAVKIGNVAMIHGETKYTVKDKPSNWSDNDVYKIIEI